MHKIAILQSNYLPWKGVFDMIHQVDEFVFLDDVQYTQHDWRNRNKIMTVDGPKWITVPVKNSSKFGQRIDEAEIMKNSNWQRKHKQAFIINYNKAIYFKEYEWIFKEIYDDNEWEKISELNIYTIKLISQILGIKTNFINAKDIPKTCEKDDRLIEICKYLGANYYLSGPAAKAYIQPDKFEKNNIQLEYIKYEYPVYKQLHTPFEHGVTILDVLLNCGKDTGKYIWG